MRLHEYDATTPGYRLPGDGSAKRCLYLTDVNVAQRAAEILYVAGAFPLSGAEPSIHLRSGHEQFGHQPPLVDLAL
jgi:hypothetical protein